MPGFLQKALAGAAGATAEIAKGQIENNWEEKRRQNIQRYQAGQNQLNRDQNQAQHEDRMKARAAETKSRDSMNEEKMAMARDEHEKSLKVLDQKIAAGDMDMKQRKEIQSLRDALAELDPADVEAVSSTMSQLAAYGVKFPKSAKKVYTVENDQMGEDLVEYDPDTSTARKIQIGDPESAGQAGDMSGLFVGAIVDGMRYKGGNPNDPRSWEDR